MIARLNSSAVSSAYLNSMKSTQQKEGARASTTSQNSDNKIEKLKTAIESGEYKVDIPALANKMADELL